MGLLFPDNWGIKSFYSVDIVRELNHTIPALMGDDN